jgi:cell division septal protein FtsQ
MPKVRRAAPGPRTPRKRNSRRPDYLLLVRHIAALVLLGQLLRVAFASPRLAIRTVEVTGAERVPARHVAELAGVQPGCNIFCVNLAQARQQILREPMVRETSVTRVLPDRIAITVQERVPRLVIHSGERFLEVDDLGVVFRERRDAASGLPLLELPQREAPERGETLPGERWQAILECMNLVSRQRLPMRKMLFDEHGELWLNMAVSGGSSGGERLLPVRLGRCDELDTKLTQLAWVLPSATADGEYLDMMCPGRAAYRRIGAASSRDSEQKTDGEGQPAGSDAADASASGPSHNRPATSHHTSGEPESRHRSEGRSSHDGRDGNAAARQDQDISGSRHGHHDR